MEKITLCFNGLGINNINQAKVSIYDLENNLIKEEKTYNGKLSVYLKAKRFYKIKAKSYYEILLKTVYINQCTICLSFSNSLLRYHFNFNSRTFYLTDYNYPNLPIEKGTIILG